MYAYSPSSVFPTQTYPTENYWVDVVFATSLPPDTTAPTVHSITPTNGATGVALGNNIAITFNEMMDPASVNTNTFELRDSANMIVPATVTAGGETPTVTLDPISSLVNSMTYTATVKGGATGPSMKDQRATT